MSLIIYIFRDVNSESPNMEMHYSCLYFRDQNREFLKHDFCSFGDALMRFISTLLSYFNYVLVTGFGVSCCSRYNKLIYMFIFLLTY